MQESIQEVTKVVHLVKWLKSSYSVPNLLTSFGSSASTVTILKFERDGCDQTARQEGKPFIV